MNKNEGFFKHPLVLTLCSGLVVGIVGTYLTDQFAQKNLEKQMQLELYKDLIHQQCEFVDRLTTGIYCRMYKLSSYFDNLGNNDSKIIEESFIRYKEERVTWNTELMLYLINLDRYFPKEEFKIEEYVKAKELFKDHLNYSFRQILEKDIQPRFYKINNALNELDKTNTKQIDSLSKEIDDLYKRVYEFAEALSQASAYYKISAETRLSKENFK